MVTGIRNGKGLRNKLGYEHGDGNWEQLFGSRGYINITGQLTVWNYR
jgi:hypothetical protein